MTATAPKVHVIRLLPKGNSQADRKERAHLQASRWLVPGAPKDEGVAGRAYAVSLDLARNLLAKGWTLCNKLGQPVAEDLPEAEGKPVIRPGTEAWFALPVDRRPGTEEFRAAEFERKLRQAYLKELTDAHTNGDHKAAPDTECPVCPVEAAEAAAQALAAEEGATVKPGAALSDPGQDHGVQGAVPSPGGQEPGPGRKGK